MTRWLTIFLMLFSITPLFAQGKKGKNKPKNPPPVAGEKEDESRVVLAFDPGSHTRPISALSFNQDQSKLITVGWDYTIQIWSAKTGERLDIIRLPAYGRDNGFDTNRWNHAAISADGAFVAIGGGPKLLYEDNGIPTRLLIVDVVNRRVRKMIFPADAKSPVTCLGFSANGDRLAVGFGGTDNAVYLQDNVIQLMKNVPAAKLPSEPALVIKGMATEPHNLALSRTGNKLVVEENRALVLSFDVAGSAPANWKKLGEFKQAGQNDLLEWSPDESHFAWSWRAGEGKNNTGIQLRAPDCKLLKGWTFGQLEPGIGRAAITGTLRYLDANRLYISAHTNIGDGDGRGCVGVLLDPVTGKSIRRFSEASNGQYNVLGTASTSGMLGAITTQKGLEAVIYSLADGKVIARCGSRTPMPTIVGWSKDAKLPAISWSDEAELTPSDSKLKDLKYGFDLATMEPVAKVEPAEFALRLLKLGEWSFTWGTGGHANGASLKQGDKEAIKWGHSEALSLIPNGTDRPLFARAAHDYVSGMGSNAYLYDVTGKVVAELLPAATQYGDVVTSPDGRYVLFSTGTHRMSIYRTDGSRFPLLNLVQVNGEWVCWSPEGYYAASPGGERLIGWSESKGPNEFPVFHSAEKFAKEFRRPDVLKLAIEKGSLSEALDALKTETRDVADILPPNCALEVLKKTEGRIQVRATATAGAEGKPVVALRLLLNGRPLAGGNGQKSLATGEKAEATWEIDVPAGSHELKLLALDEDRSGRSAPLVVEGPISGSQQPVLHRLCVGVDKYAVSAFNLKSAVQDAMEVFAALEKHCVGTKNRFGAARGKLLINEQATRLGVLTAIAEIRKTAKPGDLVIFHFAGHGVKQKSEYYLMTHEGDPSQSLELKSLSGADLRGALSDMECTVLLVMDSCHAARGVKSFRPATDDLTRNLTDDSVGVSVLAAAMNHEVASATAENGYFTAAFLKALELGEGVQFDPHEHLLYTHHIHSLVFSEVRKATNGKQTPFLHLPWTVSPFALREVPH